MGKKAIRLSAVIIALVLGIISTGYSFAQDTCVSILSSTDSPLFGHYDAQAYQTFNQELKINLVESTVRATLAKDDLLSNNTKILVKNQGSQVIVSLPTKGHTTADLTSQLTSTLKDRGFGNVWVSVESTDPLDLLSSRKPDALPILTGKLNNPVYEVKKNESLTDQARSIIIRHFEQIRKNQEMSGAITLEDYWLGVFTQSGRTDLFETARPLIERALNAGLKPYNEGKSISAEKFSTLAIEALMPSGIKPSSLANTTPIAISQYDPR